ncbi:MAG: DUF389 domain-containing protein [Oscillatoria sp. PMC 1051.18]|nr:DUF389 domain-containing protein [Oscillatoria sp. PMC 1050.18]MEC5029837.1 DUF389 domain-containing protein [Oscillatoria sp. PMC 1051.18]
MRQLWIQTPQGYGKEVLKVAKEHEGVNLVQLAGTDFSGEVDVVVVRVSNRQVEHLLGKLEPIPDLHVSFFPQGAIALQPPPSEAPDQVTDVQVRSPIEIFLAGLQSVGSWKGFLGYAALGGIVVWIGLFTNSSFLLVAAMLIAPFAGPAMNVAIATARGDKMLLWRSLLRYFAALAVTIAVTLLLSLIFQQQIATSLMVDNSQISAVTVLLPLAAGTAGGLQLVQSQRSSLVSGAATGMLVAASLAPPAGIVGMAIAITRWDMVISGVFLLILQLVGINLSAAIIFRLYGLSAKGARYDRGKKWLFPVSLGVTIAALGGLLTWQISNSPNLQRSSRAQRANADVQQIVNRSDLVNLVEANVRFTRSNIPGQNTLLVTIYVQPQEGISASSQEIRQTLTQVIQTNLFQEYNATPLVDVTVLEPPNYLR